tara:strand:+ start:60424 stop:60666 length:243 start_codon:yes stop_codon:yes gene_type:complete
MSEDISKKITAKEAGFGSFRDIWGERAEYYFQTENSFVKFVLKKDERKTLNEWFSMIYSEGVRVGKIQKEIAIKKELGIE